MTMFSIVKVISRTMSLSYLWRMRVSSYQGNPTPIYCVQNKKKIHFIRLRTSILHLKLMMDKHVKRLSWQTSCRVRLGWPSNTCMLKRWTSAGGWLLSIFMVSATDFAILQGHLTKELESSCFVFNQNDGEPKYPYLVWRWYNLELWETLHCQCFVWKMLFWHCKCK